ncbi:MAG TPA: DNA repair protein RadA [Thermoleophilaceae bacterium]|nr:DNA repair protein RadA [Thermoleophilaceae bacterium]
MPRSVFVCSGCAHQSPRWHGRCPGCGDWNTLVEELPASVRGGGAAESRPSSRPALRPVALADVEAPVLARLSTGIAELDRVLGGGLVPGSLVLLGGAPGIGKSTITASALGHLAAAGRRTLYLTAEESAAQVKLRAQRLGGAALRVPTVAATDLEAVVATIETEAPDVCVVDSVQTLHAEGMSGSPGTVGQVREVAGRIARVAKRSGVATVLVGHVTKEGSLAGPRVLEHLVDCVLQFEGERERAYRTVRALKNRFGSTDEVGVFEMRGSGLVEVADASARFVSEATRAPGSVVLCAMEGSRPLLVEVQALVAPAELVPPRRVVSGIDRNRLALVLAVLARHAGIGLGSSDVFVSAAGGVRVEEPGADLAIALALASAARGVPLRSRPRSQGSSSDTAESGSSTPAASMRAAADGTDRPLAAFGEIGLTGELRYVAHPERRSAEAAKFGLAPALSPEGPARTLRAALAPALGSAAAHGRKVA